MHICDTPLASDADNVKVTDVVFAYAAPLLMIIELFGGVMSRMMVSELHGVAFWFPAASLYHAYTVFVPSPVVNVHALDVA